MKTRMSAVAVTLAFCTGLAVAAPAKKPKEPPPPADLVGVVSRVVDGDTLWLRMADTTDPVVVRIEGIDAPESCQAGGKEATAALTERLLNREVTVKPVARDEYARVIGKVTDGSTDIGDRMVRDGHAWSTRYKYDRGPYIAEERMAQSLKRGLHGEPGAIQPRLFRDRQGACPGSGGAKPTAAGMPAPPALAAVAAPLPAPLPTKAAAAPPSTASQRCDGRKRCTQMTSCAEAKWFLKHCPGVEMDGDGDGIPCEQQWCGK